MTNPKNDNQIQTFEDCFDLVTCPSYFGKLNQLFNSPIGEWFDVSQIFDGKTGRKYFSRSGAYFVSWMQMPVIDTGYRMVLFLDEEEAELKSASYNYAYLQERLTE